MPRTTAPVPVRRRSDLGFFTPFRAFDDGRSLLDLFDAAFAGVEPARTTSGWTPAITIEETENAYIVEAELPGIKREDIHVELDDNVLHVHGETTEVERKGEVRHQTRRTGKFDYRVSLPGEVDVDKVDASLADGVLRLELAKAAPVKARTIEITEKASESPSEGD
ncbi:Hsp20/alpha crystallin family protein [Gordonia sp. NPDC003424]